MPVRPRSDEHSVDVVGLNHLLPSVCRAGKFPFLLHATAALWRTIANRDQFNARHFRKVRQVPLLADATGSDEAHTDGVEIVHGVTTLPMRFATPPTVR